MIMRGQKERKRQKEVVGPIISWCMTFSHCCTVVHCLVLGLLLMSVCHAGDQQIEAFLIVKAQRQLFVCGAVVAREVEQICQCRSNGFILMGL